MSNYQDALHAAFKPIYIDGGGTTSVSTETANDLDTTPIQLTNKAVTLGLNIRRVLIKNFSTSNRLGIHFLKVDSADPSIDTVTNGGNPAHVIRLAGEEFWATIQDDVEIWLVGSAAATHYQVSWFEN